MGRGSARVRSNARAWRTARLMLIVRVPAFVLSGRIVSM